MPECEELKKKLKALCATQPIGIQPRNLSGLATKLKSPRNENKFGIVRHAISLWFEIHAYRNPSTGEIILAPENTDNLMVINHIPKERDTEIETIFGISPGSLLYPWRQFEAEIIGPRRNRLEPWDRLIFSINNTGLLQIHVCTRVIPESEPDIEDLITYPRGERIYITAALNHSTNHFALFWRYDFNNNTDVRLVFNEAVNENQHEIRIPHNPAGEQLKTAGSGTQSLIAVATNRYLQCCQDITVQAVLLTSELNQIANEINNLNSDQYRLYRYDFIVK